MGVVAGVGVGVGIVVGVGVDVDTSPPSQASPETSIIPKSNTTAILAFFIAGLRTYVGEHTPGSFACQCYEIKQRGHPVSGSPYNPPGWTFGVISGINGEWTRVNHKVNSLSDFRDGMGVNERRKRNDRH